MSAKVKALTLARKGLRMAMRRFPSKAPSIRKLYEYLGYKWYNSLYHGKNEFGTDITGLGADVKFDEKYSAAVDKGANEWIIDEPLFQSDKLRVINSRWTK